MASRYASSDISLKKPPISRFCWFRCIAFCALLLTVANDTIHDMGAEVRIVTILGVPPVDSPRKAVQLPIVAESKGE
jgi:hypothetical protein